MIEKRSMAIKIIVGLIAAVVFLCSFTQVDAATHKLNLEVSSESSNNPCTNLNTLPFRYRITNYDTVSVSSTNLRIKMWFNTASSLCFNGYWSGAASASSSSVTTCGSGDREANKMVILSLSTGTNISSGGGTYGNGKAMDVHRCDYQNYFDDEADASYDCDDYSRLTGTTYINSPYFVLEEYNGSAWEVVCEYTNSTTQDPNTGIPCGGGSACGTPTNTPNWTATLTHTVSPTFTITPTVQGCLYGDQLNNSSLAGFWTAADIGDANSGSQVEGGSLTVSARGSDIYNTSDGLRYVYQTMTGDFDVNLKINSISASDGWAKAGIMVRSSTAENSIHFSTIMSMSNGFQNLYRTSTGGTTGSTGGGTSAAVRYVRVVKSGTSFTGYYSTDGSSWTSLGTQTVNVGTTFLVGIASTSHNVSNTGTFSYNDFNVTSNACSIGTSTVTPSITQTHTNTPAYTFTITRTVTQTVTQTVTRTITQTVTQTVTRTVTQTITPSVTPSYTYTITPTITPNLGAFVLLTKSINVTSATIGDTITYCIAYNSQVDYPVNGFKIWDTMPSSLTYLGCDNSCTQSGGLVQWTLNVGAYGGGTVCFWARVTSYPMIFEYKSLFAVLRQESDFGTRAEHARGSSVYLLLREIDLLKKL